MTNEIEKVVEPKDERRWFQYGLRVLLLITFLLGLGIGYIANLNYLPYFLTFLVLLFVGDVWAGWSIRKMQRMQKEKRYHYSKWKCPDCGMLFGDTILYVLHKNEILDRGKTFTREVSIRCPHCRYFNTYDSQGLPLLEQGIPFDEKLKFEID